MGSFDILAGMTSRYNSLIDSRGIDSLVSDLAKEILTDYPEKSPLFVVLLKGAAPFASKLAFDLVRLKKDYHPELDYMLVSTYGQNHQAKQPVIVADLAPNTRVEGREVVILDDVIDLGITSDFVKRILMERGAKEVKLAVFTTKKVPARQSQPDYSCFDAGEKWLVGFGLDDAELTHEGYRWLPELWEINQNT